MLITLSVVTIGTMFALTPSGPVFAVTSTQPLRHSASALGDVAIRVVFSTRFDPTSIDNRSFQAFGWASGPHVGDVSSEADGLILRFDAERPFAAGEVVTVQLSREVRSIAGTPLTTGFAYQFTTAAAAAHLDFTALQSVSLRTDGPTRIYGGHPMDLNQDGHTDLAVVNEGTSDVRVLLNLADGTGQVGDVMEPPAGVGPVPSPSEAADFDLDGLADLATANISGASVSVLLGRGDGTFWPQREFGVGSGPHGLAVLDFDGDGDTDIATSDTGSNQITLLANNGEAQFTPVGSIDAGNGEYALTAADMNNDGRLDLVVGARWSSDVIVLLSDGLGNWSSSGAFPAGGGPWMIVCGDVNGDRNMDVTCANGPSNNATILFGDGAGHLSAPQEYGAGYEHFVATDLGDLDGDGDLDWVLSTFDTGQWLVYENDGTGTFELLDVVIAPSNPGCAIVTDLDRDRDLDLVLLDEIADVAVLLENHGHTPDINGDGMIGTADLTALLAAWGPCSGICLADLDENSQVSVGDLQLLLAAWE